MFGFKMASMIDMIKTILGVVEHDPTAPKQTVVIVGGGFGGLNAVHQLLRRVRRANLEIILIDRRNYHLFQPLLYQVATGGLSPANICTPLRTIFQDDRRITVLMASVVDLDVENQEVHISDGDPISYDHLIVAAGSSHSYFGKDHWAQHAPGLKSVEGAITIRRRMLLAFEAAERCTDVEEQKRLLQFVIVGGGPTGVEMAGAIAEIKTFTLKHEFRRINPQTARIYLVEGNTRVLGGYDAVQSERARKSLEELGITVMLNSMVVDITHKHVTISNKEEGQKVIDTRTVVWAAGVKANPLTTTICEKCEAKSDRVGRVIVNKDCTAGKCDNVYVVGDMAHYEEEGRLLPGVAQVAKQEGEYVGRRIAKKIMNEAIPKGDRFRYLDLGSMAVIGRSRAVAEITIPLFRNHHVNLQGFLAWVAWLLIHLLYIVEFGNRVLVLIQWGWSYVWHGRAARLITGSNPFPLVSPSNSPDRRRGDVGTKPRRNCTSNGSMP